MDKIESLAMRKLLERMKRLEKNRYTVNKMFWLDVDDFGDEKLHEFLKDTAWDQTKDLQAEVELLKLVKVEDWYKDKTTVMKVLRNGKGRNPYNDSDIWRKWS